MERKYIKMLLKLAAKAYRLEEAPIAALIVCRNKVIAKGFNQRVRSNYTISHAEIEAINQANKKLRDWRLNNCTMYVTVEPCEMCEKVIKEARIDKVYYLVSRDRSKKQYDKTQIIKCLNFENESLVEKYKQKLTTFWKNKR